MRSSRDIADESPVPAASFASHGQQTIPAEYASQIPSIAFSIPDLDGTIKMELTGDNKQQLACIESSVTNGKTIEMPAVTYVAAGVAAAAFALSGVAALGAGAQPGATTPSPTFGEVFGWFQGMAMNGMMSVKYPQVYQSFASNFGFSTGLIPWGRMQTTIDNFRASTGGNLTEDSYAYLQNATLVYSNGANSTSNNGMSLGKRAVQGAFLYMRDGITASVDGQSTSVGDDDDGSNSTATQADGKTQHFVKDMQAYVEQLSIPQANTFMTLLLVFAIVIAAIIVLILLFKVILEAWSLMKPLPHSMESWRKRYWWRLAKTIVNLILLLYGVWTMYCIYQFTNGDSWAAKTLAGVSLALFTAILLFFIWRVWSKAREAKKMLGDTSKLYEDKEIWVKYSFLYDNFRRNYWWLFIPAIVYMFTRGCVIAGLNGHGLAQSAAQLIVEALMLGLLLWSRPYSLKSSNIINIVIQSVRVISVVCILVFVEELGLSQTTKTITGVVLIVVQAVLTGVLAILIAVNALIFCIKQNPHRQRRKAAEKEKMARDLDNLTPLDARNSLLMEPMAQQDTAYNKAPLVSAMPFGDKKGFYDPVPVRPHSPPDYNGRSLSRATDHYRDQSADGLVSGAASMGRRGRDDDASRSPSPSRERQPRLPDLDFGFDQHR